MAQPREPYSVTPRFQRLYTDHLGEIARRNVLKFTALDINELAVKKLTTLQSSHVASLSSEPLLTFADLQRILTKHMRNSLNAQRMVDRLELEGPKPEMPDGFASHLNRQPPKIPEKRDHFGRTTALQQYEAFQYLVKQGVDLTGLVPGTLPRGERSEHEMLKKVADRFKHDQVMDREGWEEHDQIHYFDRLSGLSEDEATKRYMEDLATRPQYRALTDAEALQQAEKYFTEYLPLVVAAVHGDIDYVRRYFEGRGQQR